MFRDEGAPLRPTIISQLTAERIVVDALQEYMGGEALEEQLELCNPKTVQALKDLKDLRNVLLDRRGWWELGYVLDKRIAIIEATLERERREMECKH